jgi:uncharacterized membrane protein YcaP (DUF421 family)
MNERWGTMTIFEMTIRCVLSFIILYLLCRILGKKLISQMTFFDFVAGVTLGSITASLIFSSNVPKWVGLYGLTLFALIVLVLDLITLKSFKGRKMINGEPLLLVKNGKFNEQGMSKARLTVDELQLQLRKKNIFYLDEVDMAFFETDGTISVLKKPEKMSATKKELQINTPSRGVPQVFILDGEILPESLGSMGKDNEWLNSILKQFGLKDVSEVAIAQIDQLNNIYIDKREDNQSL